MTEGPFDWLTAVGWSLPACALLGTQVRPGRLRLLERAREVVLVLDNDEAGSAATAQLMTTLGDRALALRLPEGVNDLSELGAAADGRQTFFRLLREAEREAEVRDAAPTP